nr:hypothetical protein GCM10020241_22620 [Streptoalloteichus tenebrarius]
MSEQRKDLPGEAELADMSRDDLVKLGTNLDGVELVHYADRWPVKGTRAERRAERGVAAWFILSGLAGLAFVGVYLFWPWRYKGPFTDGELLYSLYTPMLGLTLGVCILALGIGVLAHAKRFFNEEIAVQQRHDGPSDAVDQKTIGALLGDAAATTGLGRRSMIKRSVGFAGGMFAVGAGLFTLGGPWSATRGRPTTRTRCGTPAGSRRTARRSTCVATPATRTRSCWCGRRTSTPAASRRCSRSVSPSATTRRSCSRPSAGRTTRSC